MTHRTLATKKPAVWSKTARKEEVQVFQSLMQYKTGRCVQGYLNLFSQALQCTRFRLCFFFLNLSIPCFYFSIFVKSTSFMFTTHRITVPVVKWEKGSKLASRGYWGALVYFKLYQKCKNKGPQTWAILGDFPIMSIHMPVPVYKLCKTPSRFTEGRATRLPVNVRRSL